MCRTVWPRSVGALLAMLQLSAAALTSFGVPPTTGGRQQQQQPAAGAGADWSFSGGEGPPDCIAEHFRCSGCEEDVDRLCSRTWSLATCSDEDTAGIEAFAKYLCMRRQSREKRAAASKDRSRRVLSVEADGEEPDQAYLDELWERLNEPAPQDDAQTGDDGGGWSTATHSDYESTYCNVDVVVDAANLTAIEFDTKYRGKPVLFRNLTRSLGWHAHTSWRKQELIEGFGDRVLTAASTHRPNDRPIDSWTTEVGQTMTLADHIAGFADQAERESSLPELDKRYVFESRFFGEEAPELFEDFTYPPFFNGLGQSRAFYMYIGPELSGLWFHQHGDAWNGLVFGTKRWFLMPPSVAEDRHASSVLTKEPPLGLRRWISEHLPTWSRSTGVTKPKECVQNSGDVMYVPEDWWHATMNLNENVGVAVKHVPPHMDAARVSGSRYRDEI